MGVTSDPQDPRLGHGVDAAPQKQPDVYLVLSDEERAKGFVRPVRDAYAHVECTSDTNPVTTMGRAIAETYAREPKYYGSTYCMACKMHKSVSEFRWLDKFGQVTTEVVGS